MSSNNPRLEWLNISQEPTDISLIHPEAMEAFETTNTFQYQCDLQMLSTNILGLKNFDVPWAVIDKSGKFKIFAGWQLFTPLFYAAPRPKRIPVMVFTNQSNAAIKKQAFRYAQQLLATQLSHRSFAQHCFDLFNESISSQESMLGDELVGKTLLAKVYNFTKLERKKVERDLMVTKQQFSPVLELPDDE